MRRALLAAAGLLVAILAEMSSLAAEPDAQAAFQSLVGAEADKVAATPAKADDAAFADKLLKAAEDAPDSPKLQALLYEKAYEFGVRHRDGYAAALKAAERLAVLDQRRKADCDGKVLGVWELRYAAAGKGDREGIGAALLARLVTVGDAEAAGGRPTEALAHYRRALAVGRAARSNRLQEIGERVKTVTAQQAVVQDIAALSQSLKADPSNRALATKLLMLYLVETDDPAKAGELLPAADAGQAVGTCLPLAGKDWVDLDEQACLELGGWYQSLADKATAAGRGRMLQRAKAYFSYYLTLHGKDDGPAIRAKAALRKVQEDLDRLGPIRGGLLAPPGGVTKEILAWARQRDAMPVEEQLKALEQRLTAANGGKKIAIEHPLAEGGVIRQLAIVGNPDLKSLAPLYGMKLFSLDLSKTGVTSLEALRGMPLTRLVVQECLSLTSLAGLEGMSLEYLNVLKTSITSLEPLQGMKVKELNVCFCFKLRSLAGVEGMPLRRMPVRDCYLIDSLEPLRGMELEYIDFTSSKVADMGPLEGMPLTEVICANTPIRSLLPLKGSKLRKLNIAICKDLKDLTGIEHLPLVELALERTKFATPQTVQQLKKKIPTLETVLIK